MPDQKSSQFDSANTFQKNELRESCNESLPTSYFFPERTATTQSNEKDRVAGAVDEKQSDRSPTPPTLRGAHLDPTSVYEKQTLAQMFGIHAKTVDRAVESGQLPPGVKLFGKMTWTGAVILKHLDSRHEQARESAEVFNRHRAAFNKDNG